MDTVLITGSSTGLGLETALHLAGEGFRVYATMRDLGQKAELLEEAERRGVELEVLALDVTDSASIDRAVDRIITDAGDIFGLVNNAGIGLRGCFEDLSEAEIRQVFEANVFGTMAVTRRVLPHMRRAGRGPGITVTSVGGENATVRLSGHCSTKVAPGRVAEIPGLQL